MNNVHKYAKALREKYPNEVIAIDQIHTLHLNDEISIAWILRIGLKIRMEFKGYEGLVELSNFVNHHLKRDIPIIAPPIKGDPLGDPYEGYEYRDPNYRGD